MTMINAFAAGVQYVLWAPALAAIFVPLCNSVILTSRLC